MSNNYLSIAIIVYNGLLLIALNIENAIIAFIIFSLLLILAHGLISLFARDFKNIRQIKKMATALFCTEESDRMIKLLKAHDSPKETTLFLKVLKNLYEPDSTLRNINTLLKHESQIFELNKKN